MTKTISGLVGLLVLGLLALSLMPLAAVPVGAGRAASPAAPSERAAGDEHAARYPAIPREYRADVVAAGERCEAVDPALVAAQIETESGWDPQARSRAGAQGISQVIPSTWRQYGRDHDGDGRADPFDPVDAIATQADILCRTYEWVQGARAAGVLQGDPMDLTLASYNAGPGAVRDAGGVPDFAETRTYVERVREARDDYAPAAPAADPTEDAAAAR